MTLETVKVRLVPALATDERVTRIDIGEVTEQVNRMPDVVSEHKGDAVFIETWDGKVIMMYEPEIRRFTDTNHMS